MANEQIDVVATQIEKQRKGYFGLSLSGMLTSSAPTIISGSVIEIAGSLFQFTSDESINASSWTAISTASDVYIYLESDGATAATLTAYFTDTAPTWREDYNGWYMSAGSSIRVVAGVYKTSATEYDEKYYLNQYMYSDQHVKKTDSVTFNDLTITGSISISETVNGSTVIASATSVVLSAGVYYVHFPIAHPDATAYITAEIYSDTTSDWEFLYIRQASGQETEFTSYGGVILSDGANARIRNNSAVSTYTVYLWKF